MRKTMIMMVVALALIAGACAGDATESDEYRDLEDEFGALQAELSATEADLTATRAELEEAGTTEADVPADVAAVVDEWWAANDRGDGSVAELYVPTGYHMYGERKIRHDELAAHFGVEGWTSELISGPFLVAAEPAGRYVVTIGVRNSSGVASFASALTFEIVTRDDEYRIAHTDWAYVH